MKYKYELYMDFRDWCNEDSFDFWGYFLVILVAWLIAISSLLFSLMSFYNPPLILKVEFFFGNCIFLYLLRDKKVQTAFDLMKRLKSVPKHKKKIAKEYYPHQWRDVAVECEESHINGDCSLCGAE